MHLSFFSICCSDVTVSWSSQMIRVYKYKQKKLGKLKLDNNTILLIKLILPSSIKYCIRPKRRSKFALIFCFQDTKVIVERIILEIIHQIAKNTRYETC